MIATGPVLLEIIQTLGRALPPPHWMIATGPVLLEIIESDRRGRDTLGPANSVRPLG